MESRETTENTDLNVIVARVMEQIDRYFAMPIVGKKLISKIGDVEARLSNEGVKNTEELCFIFAAFLKEMGVSEDVCTIFERQPKEFSAASKVAAHVRKRLNDWHVKPFRRLIAGDLREGMSELAKESVLQDHLIPVLVGMLWQSIRERARLAQTEGAWTTA